MQGMLGYSQGRGAQALGQVPVVSPNPPTASPSTPIGKVQTSQGNVSVIRAGTTTPAPLKPGDSIGMNDTIETGPGGRAFIQFADNTQFTLGENTNIKVDDYVYDPNADANNAAHYSILRGIFQYVGGLIDKKDPANVRIDTPVACLCIRGTQLISKVDATAGTVEVDLIAGAIAFIPTGATAAPTIAAPVQIKATPHGMQVLPLTQDQYNAIEATLAPSPPTS